MTDLADKLETELPYLRRYARALSGSQVVGDEFAFQTLQAIQSDRDVLDQDQLLRTNLFHVFHKLWVAAGRPLSEIQPGSHADEILSALTPDSREALLLATIEGCSRKQIAFILATTEDATAMLLREATREMQRSGSGRILVIEDESIIAADLTNIVEQVGHQVIGVGRTHQEALALATETPPDLILADIQLADGSSGIDAVRDILLNFGAIPVIFITAFPERLLTGKRPEPAFLITKPYTDKHVTSAVSQAMFFASTKTLGTWLP